MRSPAGPRAALQQRRTPHTWRAAPSLCSAAGQWGSALGSLLCGPRWALRAQQAKRPPAWTAGWNACRSRRPAGGVATKPREIPSGSGLETARGSLYSVWMAQASTAALPSERHHRPAPGPATAHGPGLLLLTRLGAAPDAPVRALLCQRGSVLRLYFSVEHKPVSRVRLFRHPAPSTRRLETGQQAHRPSTDLRAPSQLSPRRTGEWGCQTWEGLKVDWPNPCVFPPFY